MHLALILLAMLCQVSPSTTASAILAICRPYWQATHFGIEEAPVFLASGDVIEQPLALAISDPSFNDAEPLLPMVIGGSGPDDRQQRFLRAMAALVEADQSSLIAEWLLPLINTSTVAPTSSQETVVTLLREPTLLSTIEDDEAQPPYQARIIFNGESIGLVQLRSPRLTATAQ
ncbi:MAG: hypothetical protein AAF539_04145 [Planctomycetota bacterium]